VGWGGKRKGGGEKRSSFVHVDEYAEKEGEKDEQVRATTKRRPVITVTVCGRGREKGERKRKRDPKSRKLLPRLKNTQGRDAHSSRKKSVSRKDGGRKGGKIGGKSIIVTKGKNVLRFKCKNRGKEGGWRHFPFGRSSIRRRRGGLRYDVDQMQVHYTKKGREGK